MNRYKLALIIVTMLFATPLKGQSLQDLNWLSGYWTGTVQGVEMEELWTPASGNMILGLHRDVRGDNSSFEFLRITINEDGNLVYLAAPSGREPTEFLLVELTANRVVFENMEHDFPQRIIYSRAADQLTARIEDEIGEQGMQWTWTKSDM